VSKTGRSLPLNTIIHSDCLAALADLPEKSVDVIFADPPYNLQLDGELWRPNQTIVDAVTDAWDQFDSFAAYDAFTGEWLSACRRVLSDTGTLWAIGTYHNIFRIGSIMMDLGFWFLNQIAWIKTNPTPNFRGTRFTNAHETLIWAQKHKDAKYVFNYWPMKDLNEGKQMRSDWVLPICTGSERIRTDGEKAHSTQKPEALLYRVILASTDPGDIVLDPFFGTGTSGAVAKRLHRQWIGIEREAKYVEVARRRIEAITPEPYDAAALDFPDPRRLPRVPFRHLLERGLIQPGATLTFQDRQDITATVLATGKLRCGELEGSIHQIARELAEGPINGWDVWFLADGSGKRKPISTLRQIVRRELGADG